MNKDLVIGFVCAICFFCLIAATQISYKKDSTLQDEFQNIYQNFQQRQFKVYSSTPALKQLQNREVVLYGTATATSSLMWRNGNDVYAVVGSCVTINR